MTRFSRATGWLSTLLALPLCACESEGPPVAEETPNDQFVLETMRFKERLEDGTLWSGTAARAEGGLDASAFEDIELHVTTAGEDAKRYIIRSPRADLNFEEQTGTFSDMVLVDEAGAQLRAGLGHYEGSRGVLEASGPVRFLSPGLAVEASSGVVDLENGKVDIEGPVQGHYEDPPASP